MSHYEAPIREPLILGDKSYHDITEDIAKPIEGKANKNWYMAFYISLAAMLWGFGCIFYTVGTGIGVWGLSKNIGWAWDITNFVWWVGIGHAGTLISAVLLLFRQKWRMAINRSAEAMTIFAVFQAGLFPIIHMGRPWNAFWVLPIPNQFGSLWVNFNSPLLWDVFAISTYLSVSLVFWWTGLLPDFAMIRDRAVKPFQKKIYSLLSFGWSGRAKDWQRFEEVSLVLAGLATPLVLSVHTIVSMDFATSINPGWHSTIFPPYFVAGAIFSGFAMVQTLLGIMRKVTNMEEYITRLHVEYMNIVIILTGGIVAVAYATEFFIAWYTGSPYEYYTYLSVGAATGPYAWAFYSLLIFNIAIPQLLWFKKIRRSFIASFIISIAINIGMWFERFDIIAIVLSKGHLPSTWWRFEPTFVDVGIFIGTIGFFFVLFLLYARTFPVIAQAEVKTILKSSGEFYKKRSEQGIPTKPAIVVLGSEKKSDKSDKKRYRIMGSSKVIHAFYNDDEVLLDAVKTVKAAHHHIEEVFCPFPVHGLDKAMGLAPTRIAITAFMYGITGLSVAIWMTNYMMIQDWPQDIGGKPSFSWFENMPAFVPIMFELTVFFAAHLMVITFYMRSKIWPFRKAENPDPRTTDDHFLMEIPVHNNEEELTALLAKTGAVEINVVEKH